MVGGVAQNIVNVTDTAFLGNLGDIQVGAAGNAGILYFIFAITGMGFTTGSQIIIGRRNGEKNYNAIGRLLDQTIYFVIPLGILMLLMFKFLAPGLLHGVVESKAIYEKATAFIDMRSWGILFAFINFSFNAFYVGITRTRILMLSTFIMSMTNVILDYGLIFGHFGLPKMGIEGAALASVIAEFAAMVFIIFYTVNHKGNKVYELFRFEPPDLTLLKDILRTSVPIMFQNFITLGSWFAFFAMIEWTGESELAISHIVKSIYMVLTIPIFGLSIAANTLTSNLIGEGRSNEVLPTVWKIIGLSIAMIIPLSIISFIFSEQLILLYTDNLSLVPDAIKTLWVINFSIIFFSVAFILFNGVTGTGKTVISMLIECINITIYLGFTYALISYWKPEIYWVWCGEFVYFTFLGLMAWAYLKFGSWKVKI